ncbi:hypothetical protein ACJX0J_030760, partial [Zea mays]
RIGPKNFHIRLLSITCMLSLGRSLCFLKELQELTFEKRLYHHISVSFLIGNQEISFFFFYDIILTILCPTKAYLICLGSVHNNTHEPLLATQLKGKLKGEKSMFKQHDNTQILELS